MVAILKMINGSYHKKTAEMCSHFVWLQLAIKTHKISCKCSQIITISVSVVAIFKIFKGGYHNNQVICPDICMICYIAGNQYTKFHACKYSNADQIYSTFEFSVAAILNQVICPNIWYDLVYSWPSIHKFHANIHMYT